MNTCDTCKWWAPYGSDVPKYPKGISLCWHDRIGPIDPLPARDDKFLSTMSLSRAVTGPKFGCVHHEPE